MFLPSACNEIVLGEYTFFFLNLEKKLGLFCFFSCLTVEVEGPVKLSLLEAPEMEDILGEVGEFSKFNYTNVN